MITQVFYPRLLTYPKNNIDVVSLTHIQTRWLSIVDPVVLAAACQHKHVERQRDSTYDHIPVAFSRDSSLSPRQMDTKLIQKASKLSAVANALQSIDLESIAKAHKGVQAAAAIDVLNASIACASNGASPEQMRIKAETIAAKLRRDVERHRLASVRRKESANRRRRLEESLEKSIRMATERKTQRLRNEALRAKGDRDRKLALAASRRDMSEAKRRFGTFVQRSDFHPTSSFMLDDPLLRKARSMCDAAATVVKELNCDFQKVATKTTTVVVVETPEERELLARANALLADYNKPPEKESREPRSSKSPIFDPFRTEVLAKQNRRLVKEGRALQRR